MCFQGESTTTIKNPTTPEPDSATGERPWWVDTKDQGTIEQARGDVAARRKQAGIPDDAPDFTDSLLEEARKRMAGQLIAKSSRRQSMQNNPGPYSL